jgi:hypothetical protein
MKVKPTPGPMVETQDFASLQENYEIGNEIVLGVLERPLLAEWSIPPSARG